MRATRTLTTTLTLEIKQASFYVNSRSAKIGRLNYWSYVGIKNGRIVEKTYMGIFPTRSIRSEEGMVMGTA